MAPTAPSGGALAGQADVAFRVQVETSLGDRVFAVGSSEVLGAWAPGSGLEMNTGADTYPRWCGSARLPASEIGSAEYKFVVIRQDGSVCWEPGPNRQMAESTNSAEYPVPTGKSVLAPRFGDSSPDAPRGHLFLKGGVPHNLSLASTCLQQDEDDSPGTCTSRCNSSIFMQSAERISEEDESSDKTSRATSLRLWAGAHRISKPGGCCEDAYFFNGLSAGVADGVGQMADYAKYGIDAAAYASDLMEGAARSLSQEEDEPRSPRSRTARAVATAEATAPSYGASTVTVLAIDGTTVGATNLGDSGFMLLRAKPWGMELVERSREQNHGWNCPFQLTRIPKELAARTNSTKFDTAEDCDQYSFTVQPGDLFLLYTDGLTDNLHWHEVLRAIEGAMGGQLPTDPSTPPEAIAEALVLAAKERSLDPTADSPFATNARRHKVNCPGGKIDDVTVVAAWVVPADAECATTAGATVLSCPIAASLSRRIEH